MNKKTALCGLLAFIVAATFGCSVLQGTSTGGGENYFPHTNGLSWVMIYTSGERIVTTVEGTATVGSVEVQVFYSTGIATSGGTTKSDAIYKVDSSGVFFYGSSQYPFPVPFKLFQFPLEIGANWTVYSTGGVTMEGTVLTKENLTVPAGTFNCYKVKFTTRVGTIEPPSNYIWLGENTGPVKIITNYLSTTESFLQSKNF